MGEELKDSQIDLIPEGWGVTRLGHICGPRRDTVDPSTIPPMTPYVSLGHIDSADPKLRRWDTSAEVRSAKSRFVPGDVLYGKLRPYLNKAVLAEIEGVASTDIIVLEPRIRYTTSSFLLYVLHTRRLLHHAIATTTGTNLPRTHWSSLRDFQLALPPLPEQRRIAAALGAIQDAIAAQDDVIAAARELKRSLMERLFTYGPGREPAPTKETEIGEIPAHWEIAPLGSWCQVKGGKRLPKGHQFSYVATPYPYIRVTDFADWSVKTSDLRYLTSEDRHQIDRYIITVEDVYISIAGTIGEVGSIPASLDGSNLTENAARIIIQDREKLLRDYLVAFLASSKGQKQIAIRTSKTSQPKLALARIKQIPVPVPPRPDQRLIGDMLFVVGAKIAAEVQRKAALEELFRSALEQLMTGQIRLTV